MDAQLRRRRVVAIAAALVAAAALALPVLAASPSPSAGPKAHGNGNGPVAKPDKSHAPEAPITVHGTIAKGTDGQGRATYTLQANGKTYDLSIGPPWFWGDKNPLEAYVGKTVTVAGDAEASETAGSETEVDVDSVDGKVLREPGKPPWAGGPKVVGPAHPGYKAWKAAQDKTNASGAPN
jgi:hypothetical protein